MIHNFINSNVLMEMLIALNILNLEESWRETKARARNLRIELPPSENTNNFFDD